MEKVVYSLVYNRKGSLLKDGTASISLCAYLNGKRKYFTTEIKVKPNEWDKKRQKIRPNAQNFSQKNEYLRNFLDSFEKYEFDKIAQGEKITLECLSERIKQKENKTDFLEFFYNQAKNNKTITENTRRVYYSTYKHLSRFKQTIMFDDLNYKFIRDFEGYLLDKGININSTGKYLKIVKAAINLAINYGYFDMNNYPFRNFKIKSQASNRTYLEPDEIERIEALNIPDNNKNLKRVRDMYLFGIYSGLRFSDIIRISNKNIQKIDGKTYIVLEMEKTKEALRLPIYLLFNGKPIELLNRYNDTNRKYYFDDFTNQYVNRELKVIAREARINKTVTFHTARHTTATYLIYKGVPMAVVQKILGHTKISTTQIYAKVMDMTIEKELNKVFI